MDLDVLSIFAGVFGLAIGYRLAIVPLYLLPRFGVRLRRNGIFVAAIICSVGVAVAIQRTFEWVNVGRSDAVPLGTFLGALFCGAAFCLGHVMYRVVKSR